MGTLPRPCKLSPSRYGRFIPQSIALSWVATSMALSTISSLPFEIAPIMPLQAALSPCVDNFIYVPLRIAQGAFERVPLVIFRQSKLQKAASVLWLYRQTLMTGKYFFLTKKMMKPVTLHQKIPSRHALRNGIFLIW